MLIDEFKYVKYYQDYNETKNNKMKENKQIKITRETCTYLHMVFSGQHTRSVSVYY